MNILVLNSGSSSVKYQLFDMRDRSLIAGGIAERIGAPDGRLRHRFRGDDGVLVEQTLACALSDHGAAFAQIAARLPGLGDARSSALQAIGHRVVHGGERFREPTRIDAQVIDAIRQLSSLAPLHNPANLLGIEVALALRPDLPQVAVFDTAFHQSIPARAYRYAIPSAWYEDQGIRRYGFHGTSHAYVSKQAARFLGRPLAQLNLITLHLGNGASAAAVAGGESIDTSMGFTPLEGLVMGTRTGDLDPGVLFHMAREGGLALDALDHAVNTQSGLLGLCGSSDVRDVLAAEASGDAAAGLALQVYVYRIRKYIGAYTAALGRVDALVFTAGVGENSAEIRARVCEGLSVLGVELSAVRNRAETRGARAIHADGSAVQVLVVPTDEELEIAEQTAACIARTPPP